MKKMLIATVAVVTVMASPALAQYDSVRRAPTQPSAQFGWNAPEAAFAQQYRPDARTHSANPSYDVYDGQGSYVGTDPDPRVRDMLRRDQYWKY